MLEVLEALLLILHNNWICYLGDNYELENRWRENKTERIFYSVPDVYPSLQIIPTGIRNTEVEFSNDNHIYSVRVICEYAGTFDEKDLQRYVMESERCIRDKIEATRTLNGLVIDVNITNSSFSDLYELAANRQAYQKVTMDMDILKFAREQDEGKFYT